MEPYLESPRSGPEDEHRPTEHAASGPRPGALPAMTAREQPAELDPVIEAYLQDVDRSRLRANLERSVEERLRSLVELQRFAAEVRRATSALRPWITIDLEGLLRRLAVAGVDLVVVGGVAAVAHGGSRFTHDLDLVYSRAPDNLDRLVRALAPIAPHLRGAPPGLPFRLDHATLRRGLNFPLATKAGEVDLLGEIVGGGSHEDLVAHSTTWRVFGVPCRFLDLDWLIRVYRATGRPRDLEAVAELEALRFEAEALRAEI